MFKVTEKYGVRLVKITQLSIATKRKSAAEPQVANNKPGVGSEHRDE